MDIADGSRDKKRTFSTRWKLVAGASLLIILATFVLWGVLPALPMLVVTVGLLASTGKLEGFHRLIYLLVVPIMALSTIVGEGMYWVLGNVSRLEELTGYVLFPPLEADQRAWWSAAIGLGVGVVVPLATLELVAWAMGRRLAAFSGLDRPTARRICRSLLLNTNYDILTIGTDGQPVTLRKGGELRMIGGPGAVIVPPGFAVVLERGGKVSRIAMAEVVPTKRFEFIREVINVRPQSNFEMVENVLTKDGVPLTIESKLFYQITPGERADKDGPLPANPYPVSRDDVKKAAFNYREENWRQATVSASRQILRDVVAERQLDEICEYDDKQGTYPRNSIRAEVMKRLNEPDIAPSWGVKVTWADIGVIEMPQDARNRLLERWLAEREEKVKAIAAKTRAMARLQEAEADGQALYAVQASQLQVWARMLQRVLNTISRGTPEEGRIAAQYIEALAYIEGLQKLPGAVKVFAPADATRELGLAEMFGGTEAAGEEAGEGDDGEKRVRRQLLRG